MASEFINNYDLQVEKELLDGAKVNILRFLTEYGHITQIEEWELKVWPILQKYNELCKPILSQADLRLLYDSIYNTKLKFPPAMSFASLMSQEFPKARYIIEPFFESGTVNMVSAPPNTWKSWLLFYFAARIAKGASVLDKFNTEKAKVMIVNEEDSHRAVQDRFNILNIKDKELPIYFRIAQGAKLEVKFIENIIKEAKEKDISVIMFDSLRSMHNAEENDSTAMQTILDLLKTISREGITVIFTHHHRKKSMFSRGDDAEATRGSSAINAAISGHISLEEEERDSGNVLIIRQLKSKAGEKLPAFEIKINKKEDGGISFSYDGDLKTAEKKLNQTMDKIMYLLSSERSWKTAKDFVSLGIAGKNIIRGALKSLESKGKIESISRKEATDKRIAVDSTGKSNELLYKIIDEDTTLEQKDLDWGLYAENNKR